MRTLLRTLVALAGCLHLCGGHYGVLQLVAWSQMLVEYSAEQGLVEGTIRTFNGEHPCGLCLAIADARDENSKDPAQRAPDRAGKSGLELRELVPCEFADIRRPEARDFSPSDPPSPAGMAAWLPAEPEVQPPRGC